MWVGADELARRFNAGIGEVERTIVTSTGPFIVAWNFRHVKAGNVNNYTLRRCVLPSLDVGLAAADRRWSSQVLGYGRCGCVQVWRRSRDCKSLLPVRRCLADFVVAQVVTLPGNVFVEEKKKLKGASSSFVLPLRSLTPGISEQLPLAIQSPTSSRLGTRSTLWPSSHSSWTRACTTFRAGQQ